MIPIVVNPARTSLALVGRGAVARRRLAALLAGGADAVAAFSDAPSPGAGRARRPPPPPPSAGARRVREDLGALGRRSAAAKAASLAALARRAGALVNVEDVKDGCDFHNRSAVRRDDFLLTVSTRGRSPGLAARIRRQLPQSFGPEWALPPEQLGARRDVWQRQRRHPAELAYLTNALIDRRGWLAPPASRGAIR
jgi:precorrin-2 dehydrogenase/sirohydrochlorin ferrochelatase